VDHPVAVGAQQGEVFQSRLAAFGERVDRLRMVSLDVAATTLPIGLLEVKPTGLAGERAVGLQRLTLAGVDQLPVPLTSAV
jgi:hypothetical protein